MAVKFRDYYEVLGVPREATPDQIQRAFRDLARKNHPDVDKRPDANKRFAEINEAYEVLKDPEKRKRYDQLGSSYKQGQQFTPPPGWENVEVHFGPGGAGGFSDFFQSIFGSGIFGEAPTATRNGGRGRRTRRTSRTFRVDGDEEETASDVEIKVDVTPWDAALGAEIHLRTFERPVVLKMPPGTQSGQKLRLRGLGLQRSDGTRGDAYVLFRIVVPKTLTPREKDLFESLRRESRFKPEGSG